MRPRPPFQPRLRRLLLHVVLLLPTSAAAVLRHSFPARTAPLTPKSPFLRSTPRTEPKRRCLARCAAAASTDATGAALTPPGFELPSLSEPAWQKRVMGSATPDPYRVALRILPLVLVHVSWSVLLGVVRIVSGRWICAPPLIHSLLGAVLGLLLAFRTNQAYGRYWSACQSWTELHATVQNMLRTAAAVAGEDGKASRHDRLLYTSILRHVIAFPIALKQRYREQFDMQEYLPFLWPAECEAMIVSSTPHLVLLSSLNTLIRPIRTSDTGSGQNLALWNELSACINQMQKITCSLDLVAELPLPASYSLLTTRFLFVWVATLPIVLLEVMHAACVPLVMLPVAWALYSTEELAALMEAPFGTVCSQGEAKPETLPLDLYCDKIVSELKQQAVINRALERRVEDGQWVVKPKHFTSAATSPDRRDARDVDVDAGQV